MKISIMFMGMLTLLAGVVPLVGKFVSLPAAIMSGVGYSALIIVIGAGGMAYGIMSQMNLFGAQKFIVALIGFMTLLGGVLPFVAKIISLPAFLTSGFVVPIVVIISGIAGIAYGVTQF